MTDRTAVRNALEALTDVEVKAIAIATKESPQVAPSLITWIKATCEWETKRRVVLSYELQPPNAAIDPSEVEMSINATIALRESFASSDFAPDVLKFFDVLLGMLTDEERKQ